ncbi:MAG TPA: hypothetical protein VHB68_21045 [Steroidobacteraceae bacterium]|nr:hypothetical protein [Steroidobacteraceae bacterium]
MPPKSPLKELNTAELFVVSSLLLWMLPRHEGFDSPDWRQGFLRARIDTEGALGFDTFCRILGTSTLQPLLAQHCAPSAVRLALPPAQAFARALRTRRLWLAFHFDYPTAQPRGAAQVPGSAQVH